ncbi:MULTISPECIES: beta-phosphoglucomutase [Sphingobacterium]|uniref:Beta-phosphoglucomutase n=1 Tax=Sphingobacterium cellulitidis TaxID=1768011 RepID=A0A8H9FZR0_9SPHI|nr:MULTISPECIES: beta-phosphoglucomutase [Sphingobacterium]MBA8987397.1 beta-phosphoglucomutase [Sphingobacterium soli]OYD41701.1 beta-phosphoglucomutase [Sphingobacterium cellulitidis]OYD46399.1 beta-phosphoglucomutase [Sphingobacterium cellulitidis]WFB63126.1 beta-phosphoglucomutase [Sphingobacterium sp. WM]GGE25121.1 beta-phosphoglucomutase [Sphingobacterium soli]
MGLEACLFDLDGVLVDTAKYHYLAWKQLANTLGLDFTEKENEQLKGISRVESLRKILNWAGMEMPQEKQDELASLKNGWYVEMISGMTQNEVLPGALKLLDELKANHIKIGLGSASKNAKLILDNTGLKPYFDALVDGNIVSKSKPDPEVFLRGAELLGVSPEYCVVFEDASAGVEAAIKGNMKAIGIGNEEELGEAQLVVEDLTAIDLRTIQNLF